MTSVIGPGKEASLRGDPSTSPRMTEWPKRVLTGAERRIFILTWVQGLAPAQGCVKPTVVSYFNRVIYLPSWPFDSFARSRYELEFRI
jgi:hypothetical protein